MPHGGELLITENGIDDTGTVDRRVGIDRARDLLDAAHDNILLSLALSDNREATSTLTIKTEVLGERLEEHDIVGVLLEEFEGIAVTLEITGGEALVSGVESREQLLALDDLKNLLPLSVARVDTSRVVGADVEHHDGVVLGCLKISLKAIEVEALSLRRVVAVLLPVVANKASNSPVDGPCGSGDKEVNILVGVPLAEEGETEAERTSTRDGLGTGDAALLQSSTVLTVSKLEAFLDVAVKTADGQVLVVHLLVEDDLLGATDARENVRKTIVILVSAHTEEDLLGVGLLLVGIVKAEDGISRSGSESSPSRESSSTLCDEIALGTGNKSSEHNVRSKIRFKF